jgi:hypothetical protein
MVMAGMDGSRVRDYWSAEVEALLNTYEQFERLIPSPDHKGAGHAGEDGRYVEDLVRAYLRRFLPQGLEVVTGFILRPAVKTGKNSRDREGKKDASSGQLDILVVDTFHYPVFQRFGDSVIVPPEGVVGIVSVKKHLRDEEIERECKNLRRASELCRTAKDDGTKRRGPYLALVGVKSPKKNQQPDRAMDIRQDQLRLWRRRTDL